ncbi:MAG TPA: head GIN domain-containing protein [Aggregatilineales bacterium]|nr:head GIN domain-containing protein [Aggregatilineales bacterium]
MIQKSFYLLAILMLSMFISACSSLVGIQGSKNIISENRAVSNFSSIDVAIGADITLIQGENESLTIETDDNILEYIQTTVQNGKLSIDTKPNTNISPSQPIKITLSFKTLSHIAVSGSVNITADTLTLETLTIDSSGTTNIVATDVTLEALVITTSGSGNIQFDGSAATQTITVSGSATINNFGLTSENAILNVSGTGEIEVNIATTLTIDISGTGKVRYMGDPVITQNITGTGTVTKAE